MSDSSVWPSLPLKEWQNTYTTLHMQSTYEAGATLAKWNRAELERNE
jgi:hypothetical protein